MVRQRWLTESGDLEENAPRSLRSVRCKKQYGDLKEYFFRSLSMVISRLNIFMEKLMKMGLSVIHLWCVNTLVLDPLFCYMIVINDEKNCIRSDRMLVIITTVLRSLSDLYYIYSVIRYHYHINRFLTLMTYAVDILVVLPLPQVLAFVVVPKLNDSKIYDAATALNVLYIIQYILRVFKTCSMLKVVIRDSGILAESAWANLSFFMLASHVLGAFWYLFSIERKASCWVEACKHLGVHCSLYCDETLMPITLLHDYCSTNSTLFEFGMYSDAFESGVVSTGFFQRLVYCFLWGLQNLSSLGQSLKTSTYFWEICFAVSVAVCGLVLFALLIGNLQLYLLSKVARTKDLRSTKLDIDMWMRTHGLAKSLQTRIKEAMKTKLTEDTVIDMPIFFQLLPFEIKKDIKRHICYIPLGKVPLLRNKNEAMLSKFCEYMEPTVYKKNSIIIQEGEPLVEMLFITRGNIVTHTSSGMVKFLKNGDCYGQELFDWMLKSYIPPRYARLDDELTSPNFPFSTRTVKALIDVEVFVLRVHHLETLVRRNWGQLRTESDPQLLQSWAIMSITAVIRSHYRNQRQQVAVSQ